MSQKCTESTRIPVLSAGVCVCGGGGGLLSAGGCVCGGGEGGYYLQGGVCVWGGAHLWLHRTSICGPNFSLTKSAIQ